jgi:hypothetical protein
MHLDNMYTAHRLEAELHTARLERARQAQEAIGSTSRRPGLFLRITNVLGRAGTRLQGAPDATGVAPAKPGTALS